jgi:CheY-like chemotaxis protein
MEVLKRIKAHPELKSMPVIMLTTTDDPREIRQSYELGCSCYITKPVNFNRFVDTLKTLGLFIMVLKVSKLNGEE